METRAPLEQVIHRTVTWFSLFETPVTVFEIWKWMLSPDRVYTLEEVYEAVSESNATPTDAKALVGKKVALNNGFKGTLVPSHQDRFLDATRKYKKLRRAVRYLKLVPGVEAIAAGNTLAWWNTRPDSDIDLFIVTRPGMIWLARLLCVTPFALLGKRPGKSGIDPFCFSFFVTSDVLDLSSLRLPGGDPYLAYWTSSLVPVFDRGGVWEKFREANRWTETVLPHTASPSTHSIPQGRHEDTRRATRFTRSGSKLFRLLQQIPLLFPERAKRVEGLNRLARSFQLKRLPKQIKTLMNKDSRVVVTDQMLKFHDNDRRAEYRDMLEVKCKM